MKWLNGPYPGVNGLPGTLVRPDRRLIGSRTSVRVVKKNRELKNALFLFRARSPSHL
jgi:hypothetical protein